MGATAIIGAAAITAGSSLIAANKQSSAAKQAAAVSAGAGKEVRADLAPFREVGQAALFELAALQGLPVNFPTTGGTIDQDGNPVQGGGFRGGSDQTRLTSGVQPFNRNSVAVPLPVGQIQPVQGATRFNSFRSR